MCVFILCPSALHTRSQRTFERVRQSAALAAQPPLSLLTRRRAPPSPPPAIGLASADGPALPAPAPPSSDRHLHPSCSCLCRAGAIVSSPHHRPDRAPIRIRDRARRTLSRTRLHKREPVYSRADPQWGWIDEMQQHDVGMTSALLAGGRGQYSVPVARHDAYDGHNPTHLTAGGMRADGFARERAEWAAAYAALRTSPRWRPACVVGEQWRGRGVRSFVSTIVAISPYCSGLLAIRLVPQVDLRPTLSVSTK
jgi:hypothetical protein